MKLWSTLMVSLSTVGWLVSGAKGQGTDVVFIVDGSGSIDSTDFQLQKNGIVAALKDPSRVPVDGTIAVAVVQFSTNAQVEFPYRLISTQADLDAATNAVLGFSQIGGSTGPGEGINTASSAFASAFRPGATQSFCLTTDGVRNVGATVGSAVDSAKSASYVLDRFSVIAIEDGPGALAADFEAEYGPHVFNGGDVFTTREFTEFANTVGALCFPNEAKLVGIEVTQTIQDLKNSVTLVEKKPTLVRSYFEPKTGGPPSVPVQARLIGRRGGSELSGSPLTASFNPTITAQVGALARRNTRGDSLNFELPSSWLSGTIELEVELVGGDLECKEVAGPTQDDCKVTVTFAQGSEVEVKFVTLTYKDGGTTFTPASGNNLKLEQRLKGIFPVARVDATTSALTLPSGSQTSSSILLRLKLLRLVDCIASLLSFSLCDLDRQYYGVVASAGRVEGFGGEADGIPGAVSWGIYRDGGSYGSNRHAHEIGHTLGRSHATSVANSHCGATSGGVTYPTGTVSGVTVVPIGPLAPDNDVIFGWDDREKRVIDPTVNYELMSYCGNGASINRERWISKTTYEAIRTIVNGEFDAVRRLEQVTNAIKTAPHLRRVQATTTYCTYRGVIGLTSPTATALFPVDSFVLPTGSTLPPGLTTPPGSFKLQTLGSAAVLTELPFQPQVTVTDILEGETNDPVKNEAVFLLAAVCDSGVDTIRVVDDTGAELTSLLVSPSAPTVEVTYPNGGESLSGDTVVIEWTGADADGDSLTYFVAFSPDGGNTWLSLAFDYTETTLTVPLSDLGETNNGLIRVRVSDGYNTGEDVSDGTFITPNTPPLLEITSPADGTVFSGVQSIFFRAVTFDSEDGNIDDSVTWTSSIDGSLGAGELDLSASQLSEGDHQITATATDSNTASTDDSITITIFRIAPPVANQPPVANCQDVTLPALLGCQADASIDDGTSGDPEDSNPIITQTPPGPYGIGDTVVTLSVEDTQGLVASCIATVTIVDDEALNPDNIVCGDPDMISPCDTPAQYNPVYQMPGLPALTKANGCPVFRPSGGSVRSLACQACNRAGKIVERDCVVSVDDALISIEDSGGVGSFVSFEASFEDINGFVISDVCTVCVEKPEQGCNGGGNGGGIFGRPRRLKGKRGKSKRGKSKRGKSKRGKSKREKRKREKRKRGKDKRRKDKRRRGRGFSCEGWSIKNEFICPAP